MNERVKELRLKLGLTQEEFGEKIGLSKSGVSNIENGTRNVSERHIKLISKTFGVSEVWIRNGMGEITIGKRPKSLEDYTNEELLNELNRRLSGFETLKKFMEAEVIVGGDANVQY